MFRHCEVCMRRLTAALIVFVAAVAFSSTGAAKDNPCKSDRIQKAVALVNHVREKRNLPSVTCTSPMVKVARMHSSDMCRRDYFSHESPDGKRPVHRFRQLGIVANTAGENIALGQTSSKEVVNEWMASPPHRKSILNKRFRRMGIGYAHCDGTPYWTQTFAGKKIEDEGKSKKLKAAMDKDASSKSETGEDSPSGQDQKTEKADESPGKKKLAAKSKSEPEDESGAASEKSKPEGKDKMADNGTPEPEAKSAPPDKPDVDKPSSPTAPQKESEGDSGKKVAHTKSDDSEKKEGEAEQKEETEKTKLGTPHQTDWDAIAKDLEESFEGFMDRTPR